VENFQGRERVLRSERAGGERVREPGCESGGFAWGQIIKLKGTAPEKPWYWA